MACPTAGFGRTRDKYGWGSGVGGMTVFRPTRWVSGTSSSRFVSSETPDVSASSCSRWSIDSGRGRFACGELSVSKSTECFLFRFMGVSGSHESGGSDVESLPNVVEGGHSPSPSGGDGGNSACSKSRESGFEGFKLAARPFRSALRALRSSDRRKMSVTWLVCRAALRCTR